MYCARGETVRADMLSLIKNTPSSVNLHALFVKPNGLTLNCFIFVSIGGHFPRKHVHLVVKEGNAIVKKLKKKLAKENSTSLPLH